MEKNRLLRIALFVSFMVKVGVVAWAVILTLMVIMGFIPEEMRGGPNIIVHEDYWGLSIGEQLVEGEEVGEVPFLVLLFFYIKSIFSLAIVFLIVHQIMKVIKSLQTYHTFQGSNVSSFRMIGKLLILFFLVNIPGLGYTSSGYFASVEFLFTPLVAALGAFVLAEIFKEGNRLHEESQLTV